MLRPDETRLAAWRSLIHANARLSEILEEELDREHGLPLAWYDVLLKLHEAGGSLRMQDLANAVLKSKSGLTRLVDRMVSAGLVRREACASDRRGTLAVLTDDGRHRLRAAAPVHLRGIEEHFGRHVSPEEAEVVTMVCERLLAAAQEEAGTPRG
ncbi:MAG TPA: MarR family transcriptional regulator [Acidimicrobiales bacterium]|jgi:DNA-binding MarR family transcriptional regulator|nr:MarR family transcriptional regulator [Acidimicrobiales bacterium]